ncbi:MAG: glycosyltransferase family 4 protein [Gammaproteobacteria bacterium]
MPDIKDHDAPRRVLLVTRNLPPVIGGMERLIGRVAETLAAHYETIVVGPQGARLATQPLAYFGCPLSPPAQFLLAATRHARAAAKHYRPQLVFAGSGLTAPIARLAARKAGARYVVYLHGLDIAARNPVYRRFFLPAIRRADLVLANSRYTAALAVEAGVPDARLRTLHPGVELPASVSDHVQSAKSFRERYGLPTAGPILFAAGRLTPRKGLADFVERVLPAIIAQVPAAQLVIAGEVPRHAAKRVGDEANAIRTAAAAAGIAQRVHLIGPLDDDGLALAWSAADVHVFPVRNDPHDPEGFGMVALEAAAHGVPTVAFAAGGIPDAVADGMSGYLVHSGDYIRFAERVHRILAQQPLEITKDECRAYARGFAWDAFAAKLHRELTNL